MKICVKTQIKINDNQWRRKQARSQGGLGGAVPPPPKIGLLPPEQIKCRIL